MQIKLSDYPELKSLCWSRPNATKITCAEAYSLFKSYWRFVDENAMTTAERALVDELHEKYGDGGGFVGNPYVYPPH